MIGLEDLLQKLMQLLRVMYMLLLVLPIEQKMEHKHQVAKTYMLLLLIQRQFIH